MGQFKHLLSLAIFVVGASQTCAQAPSTNKPLWGKTLGANSPAWGKVSVPSAAPGNVSAYSPQVQRQVTHKEVVSSFTSHERDILSGPIMSYSHNGVSAAGQIFAERRAAMQAQRDEPQRAAAQKAAQDEQLRK